MPLPPPPPRAVPGGGVTYARSRSWNEVIFDWCMVALLLCTLVVFVAILVSAYRCVFDCQCCGPVVR